MNNDNVIPLGCVTRLDLPADQVLKNNLGELTDVILLGFDKNGDEAFISSIANATEVLWLLERCKQALLSTTELMEKT